MTKQSPPELFAQRPVRSDYARRSASAPLLTPRRVVMTAGLLIVAVIGGALINGMGSDSTDAPQEIPTIQAERPIKERPEQPGGIDIPHQDVAVFQQLDQKSGAPSPVTGGTEQLLPPPETPQAPPAPAAPSPVAEQVDATPPSVQEELPPAVTEASVPPVPAVMAAPEEPAPKKEEARKEEPKPAAVAPKEPVKKASEKIPQEPSRLPAALFVTGEIPVVEKTAAPTVTDSTGKKAAVQLASFPDEATAQRELKKYQAKYAGILGSASLRVVKADLGAKGVYYRLISSPVGEAKAKAICAALAQQKASCLLVK